MHIEREPCDRESVNGSDLGITEQSKFLVRCKEHIYDPESGSSSGATHVPDQASTVLSPQKLLPRAAILDCRVIVKNGTGVTGKRFLNDHLLQEGLFFCLSSTIQRIWHPPEA